MRQFTTPSPSITACTVTWRVMCMKSANGANIGMKITDSPVPDEIRNVMQTTYIPRTPNTGLCPSRDCASWLTIVSSNLPCSKMTEIQRAIPTIKAP